MSRTVHAACPHDCPDTCAHARHRRGRPRGAHPGRPGPPADARRAVHQGLALRRAQLPPRARAAAAEARRRPRAAANSCAVGWDEALADIAARLKAHRRARPAGHRALQLRRHDGPGAGREHGGALLPQARRLAAGPHDLLDAPAATRWPRPTAPRSACTSSTIAESRLIVIWGSNSIASNLHFWTFAQQAKRDGAKLVCIDPRAHRDRRQVPPAHRAAARHRRRAGARR